MKPGIPGTSWRDRISSSEQPTAAAAYCILALPLFSPSVLNAYTRRNTMNEIPVDEYDWSPWDEELETKYQDELNYLTD